MESKQITNPFPGLRPFETDEYRLFFGREGQSDELLARLERARFLAVVGTSGSGKSSLIRAGLLPALRGGMMAGAGWRIAVMRPGGDPIGNLAAELGREPVLAQAGGGLPAAEAEAVIDATLRSGSLGLIDVARQGRLAAHEKLLVVVDQFEELFRFRAAARESAGTGDAASAFVKLLLEGSGQRELPIYVVLTMRSDFLGDCAQFQGLPEAINGGQYLIPRLTRDERCFAITGPVGVTRGKISEPLVNRLLNDVGDNPDQLPILQHALMRTWDHWAAHRRNGSPLGLENYEAIGTMSAALSLHADEAFNELPNERSRQIAEILFKALSERGADNREIRRPTRLDAICNIAGASMAEVIAVIDVFRGEGRAFLMPPAGVTLEPETVIDISHESLIRNWQRLQKWVDEEAQSARIYRRLAEAAVLHHEGSEGLLQDPALQIALDWREQARPNAAWAERYYPEFETSIAYLDDSRLARETDVAAEERDREEQLARERRELEMAKRYAEEQHRAASRLRRLTFALVFISLLAVGTAAFALKARAQAETSRREATEAQGRAEKANQSLVASFAAEKRLKEEAEHQKGLAETRRTEALEEKARAENATKRSVVSEGNARAAQKFAVAQRAIAEKKAQEAEDNLVKLREETERNRWGRDALASFQRGDFGGALYTFEMLNQMVAFKNQPVKPDNAIKDRELAAIQGWALSNIGAAQRKLGQQSKAIESYESALAIQEKVLTKRNPELFDTLSGLGHAHREAGTFSEAEKFYKQAVKLLEDTPDLMNQIDEIPNVESRARLYRDLRRYDEADPLFRRIVELRDHKAPKSPEVVNALQEYARFYVLQSKFAEAELVYTDILAIQEEKGISDWDLRELADSYGELGRIYAGQNKYEKAQYSFKLARLFQDYDIETQIAERTSAILSEGFGELPSGAARHDEQQKDLIEMAELYAKLGKYEQAGGFYGIFLFTTQLDEADPVVVKVKLKLAELVHHHLNEYEKAAEIYQSAIEQLEKNREGDPALLSDALQQLGNLYANQLNRPAEAEALFKKALSLSDRGRNRFAGYEPLSMLADLYQRQKRDDDTEAALRRGHEIMSSIARVPAQAIRDDEIISYRTNFTYYLQATEALAKFYMAHGRVADAEVVYRQALWPLERQPGEPDNRIYLIASPEVFDAYANTLGAYIRLLGQVNRTEEAAVIAERVKKARERRDEIEQQTQQLQQLRQVPQRPRP